MVLLQRITEAEYRKLALSDSNETRELWDGVPRIKAGETALHNRTTSWIGFTLMDQMDWRSYKVRINAPRVRLSGRDLFVPDVAVIPAAYGSLLNPHELEWYEAPLPLLVEVWSPLTGDTDIAARLTGYRLGGHPELWHVDPYGGAVMSWRRQPDGTYTETVYHGGIVAAVSLPGVAIDLDALLDRRRPGA